MLKMLSKEQFRERAADGSATPVFREFLADRETPVSVLTRVADDDNVFLLESVTGGEVRGRYSYLGINPREVVYANGEASPLGDVKKAFSSFRFKMAPELPELQGGAIGYVAYDAVGKFVPRVKLEREKTTPLTAFMMTDDLLIFDNVRQTVIVSCVVRPDGFDSLDAAYDETLKKIDGIYRRLLSAESIAEYMKRQNKEASRSITPFKPEMRMEEFEEIVEKCKAAIRAGEVIQIVPSQKFVAETDIPAI